MRFVEIVNSIKLEQKLVKLWFFVSVLGHFLIKRKFKSIPNKFALLRSLNEILD